MSRMIRGISASASHAIRATRAKRLRRLTALQRDLLIAATAHAHDAKVYTRNARDFAGLEALIEVISV